MREPAQALLGAILRDVGGVAVVRCPDLGLREWLMEEVESLVPTSANAFRAKSLAEALADPHRMALLAPEDEQETVLDLDGSRDILRSEESPRTQPIVLFLLRNGPGEHALANQAVSLASWIAGNSADPEALAEIDESLERRQFFETTGEHPEAWLARWRAGELPHDGEHYALAYRAMLLEAR